MADKEALRLADALRDGTYLLSQERNATEAELRRLHAEVERITVNGTHSCHAECQRPVCRLTRERDALLVALKSTGVFLHHCWCDVQMNDYSFEKLNQQMAVVDAAIAKAKGGGNG